MGFYQARARTNTVKLTAVGGALSFLTVLYLYSGPPGLFFRPPPDLLPTRDRASCPPQAYASGQWTYNPHFPPEDNSTLKSADEVFAFNGLEGCTSDREFKWHLGVDNEEAFDRFPDVMDWQWTPGEECSAMRPMSAQSLVRDFVANGGWLILGDSISENHFFSLSCSLYPHVRSTPNYTENPYFDRAWPQNLYLNPSSPLISTLSFPPGFSIESTPLVTFRRVDLLLSQDEIEAIHRTSHPELYSRNTQGRRQLDDDEYMSEEEGAKEFKLFSEEQVWSLSPKEYMPLFLSPLPEAHYSTLILSTAGHWTTHLFTGISDPSETPEAEATGHGIQNVLELFEDSMRVLAGELQEALDEDRSAKGGSLGLSWGKAQKPVRRQVVVRGYLSGHEDCHDKHAPWAEVQPYVWKWWNWPWIRDFNVIFEMVLSSSRYPDIHYLPIDRPGMLRPDAHVTSDCLHLLTGTGVIEGWTHYIWHFVTRELPGRIR